MYGVFGPWDESHGYHRAPLQGFPLPPSDSIRGTALLEPILELCIIPEQPEAIDYCIFDLGKLYLSITLKEVNYAHNKPS